MRTVQNTIQAWVVKLFVKVNVNVCLGGYICVILGKILILH